MYNKKSFVLFVVSIALVLLIAGCGGKAKAPSSSGGAPNPTATPVPTATPTPTPKPTPTPTPEPKKAAKIEGAWHGTYEGARGKGEWAWVIKKSGNGYTGILSTTGPYPGQNLPIAVSLNGNKIKVGWVAGKVTFEGTVSGDKMSGTWEFNNGMDKGKWSGERGTVALTPKENEAASTGGNAPESTGGSEEGNFDSVKETSPVPGCKDMDKFAKPLLKDVFGGAKLVNSGMVQGAMGFVPGATGKACVLTYRVKRPFEPKDLQAISEKITKEGYMSIMTSSEGNEFTGAWGNPPSMTKVIALRADKGKSEIEITGLFRVQQ